jgi:hypothetical protein
MSDRNNCDDDNAEALGRLREEVEDCRAAALDHIRIAQVAIGDLIDAATNMWLDDHGPVGEAFKNFAAQLLEAEADLSRAEGELS